MTAWRKGASAACCLLIGAAACQLALVAVAGVAGAFATPGGATAMPQSPAGLGGYTLSATAAAIRGTYEQPDLPLPADPSVEADIGYSATSLDSGPVGQATASELYPGQVVAASGGQLGEIVPGAPALPDWPVQAHSDYPGSPHSASDDSGAVQMEARSTGASSTASAGIGSASGTAAIPSGLVTVQHLSSTSATSATQDEASATAKAALHDVGIAGGLVQIASVTSSVSGSSGGRKTSYSGSTAVAGATVAGQPVSITGSGVQAAGHDEPIGLLGLTPLQVLGLAGISMKETHLERSSNGPGGSLEADGLQLSINLSTYDSDFLQLVAELPSELAAELYQLPVPLPDEQVMTIDLAWAEVAAVATPTYVPPPPTQPPPPTTVPSTPPPGGAPSSGSVPTTGVPAGSASIPPASFASTGATSAEPSYRSAPTRSGPGTETLGPPEELPASLDTHAGFGGVGAGLIGLGALCAAGFGFAVVRGDRRLFARARTGSCPSGRGER
jgi:hypothetical protein